VAAAIPQRALCQREPDLEFFRQIMRDGFQNTKTPRSYHMAGPFQELDGSQTLFRLALSTSECEFRWRINLILFLCIFYVF